MKISQVDYMNLKREREREKDNIKKKNSDSVGKYQYAFFFPCRNVVLLLNKALSLF